MHSVLSGEASSFVGIFFGLEMLFFNEDIVFLSCFVDGVDPHTLAKTKCRFVWSQMSRLIGMIDSLRIDTKIVNENTFETYVRTLSLSNRLMCVWF